MTTSELWVLLLFFSYPLVGLISDGVDGFGQVSTCCIYHRNILFAYIILLIILLLVILLIIMLLKIGRNLF